jgi:hypothetical protein
VRDALPAFAAGRLGGAEEAAVRAHLDACAECAAERDIVIALGASRAAAPPGLAARIGAELARAPHGSRGVSRTIRWIGVGGLAAAAAMALLLAWPDRPSAERVSTARVAAAPAPAASDPFMDDALLDDAAARPLVIALDRAIDDATLAEPTPDIAGDADATVAPLAMDVGQEMGDWPGADGVSAGEAVLHDLTYEQMELLLSEMDT